MATTLVIGASRGLGRGFVEQLLQSGEHVLATTRRAEDEASLRAMAMDLGATDSLETFTVDVADAASRRSFLGALGQRPLDTVIHNAGIYGPRAAGIGDLPEDAWKEVIHVDTIAPLMMAQELVPHLRAAAAAQAPGGFARIAFLTSLMGSIADNGSGGSYLYRSAKAGLNAAAKSLSLDLAADRIAVLLLHPGWVQTDMGSAAAPLQIDESVAGMLARIGELTPESTGSFVDWSGRALPW